MSRDPRLDPRAGDRVESVVLEGELGEVVEAPIKHGDPLLGPEPGVYARIDWRGGQRTMCVMSLDTWRTWAKDGKILS